MLDELHVASATIETREYSGVADATRCYVEAFRGLKTPRLNSAAALRRRSWTMVVLPPDILPHFVGAGWKPGRQVVLSESVMSKIPPEHPALGVLAQFSGLEVGGRGRGEECAKSDVAFEFISDEWEDISIWNSLLHTTLIGVAYVHGAHGMLYIAADGKCFDMSYVADDFSFCGGNFIEAMQNYLFGRRLRPMLLPGQESVMLYGHVYTADSPNVYKY